MSEEPLHREQSDPAVVTVVIAAYNPGNLIMEAIDSALAQTLQGIEIVVVDDCSTEDLKSLLERYEDRIHYVRLEQNVGPGAARNVAIRISHGQYVAVLDSDDIWMPDRLEKAIAYMDSNKDMGLATTDSLLILDDIRTDRSWFSTIETMFHNDDQHLRILENNFVSPQVIVRRQLFETIGLYDEQFRVGEDWDRAIAFIRAGHRAGIVQQPLAYYRVRQGSLSRDQGDLARGKRAVLEKWLRMGLEDEAKRVAAKALYRAEWDCVKSDLDRQQVADLRSRLLSLCIRAPIDVKVKAALILVWPRFALRVRVARARFLIDRGSSWALQEAIDAMDRGDVSLARSRLKAVALFGFPLKIRLNALSWVFLPPIRSLARRQLLEALHTVRSPDETMPR